MDIQRIERSKKQRMYLLNIENIGKLEWSFNIEGFSGNCYTIIINQESSSCTCPDYKQRHNVCKHIMFISTRILKKTEIIIQITENISNNLFEIIQKTREQTQTQQIIKYKIEDSCTICCEDFIDKDICDFCDLCNNGFHTSCLRVWFKKKKNCPLCRHEWGDNGNDNAMSKF